MSSSPTEQIAVTMPQMGVSVTEGTLAGWHKRVGDRIESEETICEISTDKIDTDVPSPAGGWVAALLVAEGETVAVGTVLARIDADAPAGGDRGGNAGGPGSEDRAPAVYSPVVQRMAAEHGIDLARVRGTGRDGRVRKQDVLAQIALGAPDDRTDRDAGRGRAPHDGPPAAAPAGAAGQRRAPHDGARAAAPAGAAGPEASPPAEEMESSGPDPEPVREPLSRMRRAIAEHVTRSLRTAAHCTTIIEVDMSRVEAARAGAGLSPLAYVARCAVESLGVFGRLNATLEDDVLTRYLDVDLGVAVSLGEPGLIVPVIRRAQHRSVAGLAAEIRELAGRARAGELGPDEVRGATFTITNPGRFGTIAATPIINQPQVAILDLEAVVRRPVVVGDGIAIRPMANLCLSWDHRALDGVMAAEFLADVRARIERFDG